MNHFETSFGTGTRDRRAAPETGIFPQCQPSALAYIVAGGSGGDGNKLDHQWAGLTYDSLVADFLYISLLSADTLSSLSGSDGAASRAGFGTQHRSHYFPNIEWCYSDR